MNRTEHSCQSVDSLSGGAIGLIMGVRNIYEAIVHGDSRSVGPKGEIVLPKEWRDEQGVTKDDEVAVRRREDGRLEVIPPQEE